MPEDVLILGAAGTGRDVLDWLRGGVGGACRCVGFLDDDPQKQGQIINGVPVLGPLQEARQRDARLVDALGGPGSFQHRPRLVAGLSDERFLTLVHPRAHVPTSVVVGPGSLIYPNVSTAPSARIGCHVTILAGAVLNHDVVLEDFTIVASLAGLSGNVRVGSCCYVGAGAHIRQSVAVGQGALLGMGAVVLSDVPAGVVMVGNPARQLRNDG